MKIAAYCRVSTDHEDQLNSLDNQKNFFAEYADKNGHTLVHLYADEGITGTSLKKRTEFKRLMADAELGLFDMVVVKDISRFARNTVDFLQSIRQLKAIGINTVFLTANMNSLGDSEFVLTIFGAMAQEESANLSKRVKFGKLINAQKGRVPKHVYGYDRIDNFNMVPNKDEAPIVKEIFRLYTEEGFGCRKIAIRLNEMGVPTKFGNQWDTTGIKRILANSTYCGEYVNHKYEIQDYLTGKQIRTPKEAHIHHERPEWAIISKETFEAAQVQLNLRRKQYYSGEPFKDARYSSKHALSTLVKCGTCGSSFCRKSYTYVNTRVYWKCRINDQQLTEKCSNNVKIDEDVLLDAIRDYLVGLIGDKKKFIESVVDDALRLQKSELEKFDVKEFENKKAGLEKKREKFQDLYVNDIISIEELKSKTKKIDDELALIEFKLSQHTNQGDCASEAENKAKQYVKTVEEFLELKTATNMDLRKVIDYVLVEEDGKVTVFIKKL